MAEETDDEEYLLSFSKEIIYLWNDEYECFVKSVPGMGFWAKFPGNKEYQISGSSHIVVQAVFGSERVAKEVYDNA